QLAGFTDETEIQLVVHNHQFRRNRDAANQAFGVEAAKKDALHLNAVEQHVEIAHLVEQLVGVGHLEFERGLRYHFIATQAERQTSLPAIALHANAIGLAKISQTDATHTARIVRRESRT